MHVPYSQSGCDHLSRSSIIELKSNPDGEPGLAMFILNDAPPDMVYAMIQYLKMLGYPSPAWGDIGFARLLQIAANYEGDGHSHITIGYERDLPAPAYSCMLEGWGFVQEDMKRYKDHIQSSDIEDNIMAVDSCQPLSLQLGDRLIHALYNRHETVRDLNIIEFRWMMKKRLMRDGWGVPFAESKCYTTYRRTIRVLKKLDISMLVEFNGEETEVPLYGLLDGSESTVVIDPVKHDKCPIFSFDLQTDDEKNE